MIYDMCTLQGTQLYHVYTVCYSYSYSDTVTRDTEDTDIYMYSLQKFILHFTLYTDTVYKRCTGGVQHEISTPR